MKKIDLPKEAKIQFRAVPDAYGSSIDYRLEYRVDPLDEKYRYKIDEHNILFGLIKQKTKIDYSNYWLNTHIFTGYSLEENESHYMNWSLGIKINNDNDLKKYKDKYKTIGEFEDYLNSESNKNYNNWKIRRDRFLEESKKILY